MRPRQLVIIFFTIVLGGCVENTYILGPGKEKITEDNTSSITLSPPARPVMWVHPNTYENNVVTFFAPETEQELEFEVTSSNEDLVYTLGVEVEGHLDPSCEVRCTTMSYSMYVYFRTWSEQGSALITYSLRSDPRIKGSFMVHVDPRG